MFHFRVRNGTGWGHQAMTTRLRFLAFVLLQPPARVVMFACSGLCVLLLLLAVFSAWLSARLCFQQADIRVARGCFSFLCVCSHSRSSSVLSKACHRRFDRGLLDVSSARLNTLLQLHLRPIDVVVFHAPIGRTHLGRDLALRCFQRLFLPHLATRPCS